MATVRARAVPAAWAAVAWAPEARAAVRAPEWEERPGPRAPEKVATTACRTKVNLAAGDKAATAERRRPGAWRPKTRRAVAIAVLPQGRRAAAHSRPRLH